MAVGDTLENIGTKVLEGLSAGFRNAQMRKTELKILALDASMQAYAKLFQDAAPEAQGDILHASLEAMRSVVAPKQFQKEQVAKGAQAKGAPADPLTVLERGLLPILSKRYPDTSRPEQRYELSDTGLPEALGNIIVTIPQATKGAIPSEEEKEQAKLAAEKRAADQQFKIAQQQADQLYAERQKIMRNSIGYLRADELTKQKMEMALVESRVGISLPKETPEPSWDQVQFKDPQGNWVPGWENKKQPGEYLNESGKPLGFVPQETAARGVAPGEKPPTLSAESRDLTRYFELKNKGGLTPQEQNEYQALGERKKQLDLANQQRIVTIQQQGSESTIPDEDLRTLAQLEIIDKDRPPFAWRDEATRNRFARIKAGEIRSMGGPSAAAATGAEYQASRGELATLEKLQGTMQAAQSGTDNEIDRAIQLSKGVNLGDIKKFNSWSQFVSANLSDNPALARFREAVVSARYRYNSMIANVRQGGAATNQIREETADEILSRDMPKGALVAALQEMKIGISNVMKGMDDAVKTTRGKLRQPLGGPTEQKVRYRDGSRLFEIPVDQVNEFLRDHPGATKQ